MPAVVLPRKLAIIAPVLTTLLFGSWGVTLGPLLPEIADTFRMGVAVTGVLMALNFAGALVAVMLGGILADHFGKKRVFLIVLGAFSAAVIFFATAQSFALIALACLLAGALGGCLEGLCGAIIADCDPACSHRNMNWLQIAFSAGAVTALVVTSRLPAIDGAWRMIYLVIAAVAAGIFLLSLFMQVPPAPPDAPISLPIVRRVIMDPLVVLLAVAIAFYVGSEMGLAYWIRWILMQAHVRPSDAMLAPALFWAMTGVGRYISGRLCQRYAGLSVLRVLLVGGLLSFGVLLLPFGPWTLWLGTAMAGLTFSGVWPLIIGQGSTHYPAYSGTLVALLVVAGNVGGMLFPTLQGFVIAGGSPTLGLLFMAVLFAALTATIAHYARIHRAQDTQTKVISE